VRSLRDGKRDLDAVRRAFSFDGPCQRVVSLCDNFEAIAGRPPPEAEPHKFLEDVVEHGAALVIDLSSILVGQPKSPPTCWVVACVGTCRARRNDHEVCRRIAELHPSEYDDDDDDDDEKEEDAEEEEEYDVDDDTIFVYSLPLTRLVMPVNSRSWMPYSIPPDACEECRDTNEMFRLENISLVVMTSTRRPLPCPPLYKWTAEHPPSDDGRLVYSQDAMSDFVYLNGVRRLV
jgi:hypothetical protein